MAKEMAVTLVGSREGKEHPDVPVDQALLIPDVEVEDVVIHFRCGDVMGGVRRNDFGMISFSEYKKWISKDAEIHNGKDELYHLEFIWYIMAAFVGFLFGLVNHELSLYL